MAGRQYNFDAPGTPLGEKGYLGGLHESQLLFPTYLVIIRHD